MMRKSQDEGGIIGFLIPFGIGMILCVLIAYYLFA